MPSSRSGLLPHPIALVVLLFVVASACTPTARAGDNLTAGATRPATAPDRTAIAQPEKVITAGLTHPSLPFGGTDRSYRLFVPDTAAAAMRAGKGVPLLLSFHGALDTNDNLAQADGTEALAVFQGIVVAHPMGLRSGMGGGAWNAGGCCSAPARAGVDDIGFTRAVIDDISANLEIDPARVYAIGHSNGGMLAYRLACELSDRIAAAGSVGGTLEIPDCRPSRPVSFLEVHGRNDTIVPYDGGRGDVSGVLDNYAFNSVQNSIRTIRAANRCSDVEERAVLGDIDITTWTCAGGAQVRQVALARAGHIWPPGLGVETPFGNDGGYNATKDFWAFFAAHPLI